MRLEGLQKLQRECGFQLQVEDGDFREKRAYELTEQYGRDADAIVCASDLMAIGAINALKKMNIFRRVSGFDGISLMGYMIPYNNIFCIIGEQQTGLLEPIFGCGKGVLIVPGICGKAFVLKQVALVFNPLRNGNLVILKYGSCCDIEIMLASIAVIYLNTILVKSMDG